MSAYEEFRFDPERCRLELEEFERLLMERPELSERADILPFFRTRRHLAALLGSYNPNANVYDRLAIELSLFGEFTADVSAGDSSKNAFCLIEFEDGKPNSIFTLRGRRAREWASRFERGFSQIVDWLWKLDDQRRCRADHRPGERTRGRRQGAADVAPRTRCRELETCTLLHVR
ncbi:MAG: hypothetical protein AVDCRST_MAG88-2402 [uncultured Thermomicrobiales bacterium]|uniref:Shedu protein SduA C-terminal domain-containing protein n=1 Tax=uncultured Thermomicrobiales bacterium TaxID=1645740 RepID=A0A6J4VEL9_9BACT|nr:MAG: hypothetical protein AVDCRST_MAG88-2402 [uncultured Thermomicrobiales bacterium]